MITLTIILAISAFANIFFLSKYNKLKIVRKLYNEKAKTLTSNQKSLKTRYNQKIEEVTNIVKNKTRKGYYKHGLTYGAKPDMVNLY